MIGHPGFIRGLILDRVSPAI